MDGCRTRLRAIILETKGYGIVGYVQRNLPLASIALRAPERGAHSQPITRNLQYISSDKLRLTTNAQTLKLDQPLSRPLCVIMSWMLAKTSHLMKYAHIYLQKGFDVVTVTCSPWQLMWPTKGSQLIAADLMKFLESNEDHSPLMVHGFSVGAYVWAEMLVHALKDLDRYQPVLDRVGAQVWDSPADVDEIPVGMPFAMFPNNPPLRKVLTAYTRAHMNAFHNIATRHYLTATHAYHNTPCHAPALFLVSKTDPVGAEKRSRKAHDMMRAAGIKCNWKCWDESPHVRHYIRHPEEYLAALNSHLAECSKLQPVLQKATSIQS